jgi:hypothetical protein
MQMYSSQAFEFIKSMGEVQSIQLVLWMSSFKIEHDLVPCSLNSLS